MESARAKVTISRSCSNTGPDMMTLTVKVGRTQHRVQLTLEDYARVISGEGRVDGQYDSMEIGGGG